MSKTLQQIYVLNPITSNAGTDLMYFVQSPYTPATDAGMTFADFSLQFGAPYTPSALTKVDDSNVTLTLGGTPATALLQAVSLTLGWTGQLSGTRGGTGVNNGASTITIGGDFTMAGPFSFTGTLTGNTGVTFPTSGTLATTSQLLISPLTTKGDIWTWSTTNDRLPVGSVNGQVLQVASGASTGLAYSTATYPAVATNAARILRADGTNWVESTSTFADIYAASGFLYANGANNVAGLATANNGLPVTGNTGIPVILAGPGTTGNMLISNAAAAPSFSTFTMPTSAGAAGSIHISNGTNIINSTSLWPNTVGTNLHILLSDGTSNVYSTPAYPNASVTAGKLIISDGTNYIASTSIWPNTVGSAGTIIRSDGTSNAYTTATYPNTVTVNRLIWASASNVISDLATANSGVLVTNGSGVPSISVGQIPGSATNDSGNAGSIGEFVSASVAVGSAVSNSNNTARDVTSISLTAGDWQVWGNTGFVIGGTCTQVSGWISSTSATLPDASLRYFAVSSTALNNQNHCVPTVRISVNSTTTVYLSSYATFSTSTVTSYGGIYARRMR